ncbi:MAG: hypothetical protein WCL32_15890 [Planctomycetota bacterium]
MSWKSWIAASVLSCSAMPTLHAKPADLPVDQRINLAAPGEGAPLAPDSDRAVEIFQRAERHRQLGQLTDARRAYEEVHLLSPTSRVGREAIQRMRDLETPGNDFTEEQEPPLSRSGYQPSEPARRESEPVKRSRSEYQNMLRETESLGVPSANESY